MKENAEIKKNQSKRPIIILLLLFLAVTCLRLAKTDYGLVYMIISVGLLTAAVYLIIYRYLAWYSYQVTENELLFIRNIGSHDKYIMIAPLDRITYIKPNDGSLEKINYPVGDKFIGEFDNGGRMMSFSFSPSEDMQKLLKERLGDRICG